MEYLTNASRTYKWLVGLFLFVVVIEGQKGVTKSFSSCFSQQTTTQSKILQIGEASLSIFNPLTSMVGILKYSNFYTTTFITLSVNTSYYLHGNFIFNRYGAQGLASREIFTLVGEEFYDGNMLPFTAAPKMWKVIGSEYVLKLMPDNILWISHWRTLKYAKVCNVSIFRQNSTLLSVQASSKQQMFLFYLDGTFVRLFYDENLDNFTHQSTSIPGDVNISLNYAVSSDTSSFFHYRRDTPNLTSILMYKINKDVLGISLEANFSMISNQEVVKVAYCENNNNFLLRFSNNSFRICSFDWEQCYHLSGIPASLVTVFVEGPNYLVRQFDFKNITHFGVITLNNYFTLYSTSQFQTTPYLAHREWPEGNSGSQPLSAETIIKEKPNFAYPHVDINYQEEKFEDLSSSTVAIVYLVSLPQSRKLFMFLNPLYMLLENFWFYNYHRKAFRPVVNRTLGIMRIINQVKLFPLPFYSIENTLRRAINFNNSTKSDFTPVSPTKFVQIEGCDVSFLKNIQDAIIWGTLYTLLGFLILKALSRVPLLKRNKMLRQFLTSKSHQGILISGLIQSNIQFYAFMGFSQLKMPGQMEIGDKVKIVATALVLFVVTLYSIAGFIILKACFRKCWSVFIEDRTFRRGSMYFSSIWLVLQNLMTGSVNGFFQEDVTHIQVLLLAIDVGSIVCVCYFWRTAKSYISNLLLLLYLILKTGFDIVIYQPEVNEWIETSLIAAIILIILYSVFWNISVVYRDSCQFFKSPSSINIPKAPPRSQKVDSGLEQSNIFKEQTRPKSRQISNLNMPRPKSIVTYLVKRYAGKMVENADLLRKVVKINNNPSSQPKRVSIKLKHVENQTNFSKSLKSKLENYCASGHISSNGQILLQSLGKNIEKESQYPSQNERNASIQEPVLDKTK